MIILRELVVQLVVEWGEVMQEVSWLQLTPERVPEYQNCPQLTPEGVPKYHNRLQLMPESEMTKTSKIITKVIVIKFCSLSQCPCSTQALTTKNV